MNYDELLILANERLHTDADFKARAVHAAAAMKGSTPIHFPLSFDKETFDTALEVTAALGILMTDIDPESGEWVREDEEVIPARIGSIEWTQKKAEEKQAFAKRIADYLEEHNRYEEFDKRTAAVEAVRILTDDIGAAQDFLRVIGVDVDLYAYAFNTTPEENSFHQDLRAVFNKHSVENGANIPDNVLATYTIECIRALENAVRRQNKFFGFEFEFPFETPQDLS